MLSDRALEIWAVTKEGWDLTNWFFLVIGGGAIFGQFFGLAGPAAIIVSLVIFYQIGVYHRRHNKAKAKENPEPAASIVH